MELNLENIKKLLTELGFTPSIQKETQQVFLILTIDIHEYPVFFRILPSGPFLQVVIFFPFQFQPQYFNEISRFLHAVNRFIDWQGFCIEEKLQTIFYRMTVPAFDNKLPGVLTFEKILQTIHNIPKTMSMPLLEVASGTKTSQQMIEIMEKSFQSRSS